MASDLEPLPVNSQKHDPAWKHCQMYKSVDKAQLKRIYCGKMFKGGGIHRIKEHLAGQKGNASSCLREQPNVRLLMQESFNRVVVKKRKKQKLAIEMTNFNSGGTDSFGNQSAVNTDALLLPVAEPIVPNSNFLPKQEEDGTENSKDHFEISHTDIYLATQNFSDDNLIGRGRFGNVYKGKLVHANGSYTIAAKRLDRKIPGLEENEFSKELEILMEYKHENIIGLVGYCNERDERIIVTEYASRGSLKNHLGDDGLTWRKRLEICIDIAQGLQFLHGGSLTRDVVFHRDINTSNILLTDVWKAKISNFGNSFISPANKDMIFISDYPVGTDVYVGPFSAFLARESDIHAFGVVLVEILFGRLKDLENSCEGLTRLFKRHYDDGTLDEMVFKGIKEQVVSESLTIFQAIAYRCLHKGEEPPTADQVLKQLKMALEFQEHYEIWEPKLPSDYKEIITGINAPQNRKDLYHMFSKGILLQGSEVLFSLDSNGERNVMISAKRSADMNDSLHKWRYVPESRFPLVAEVLDISDLRIKIETRTQLLSPDVVYGVYLVFKISDPRKLISKPLYANLKYRNGSKTRHAYFATWRDEKWMMIELYQFLNDKEHIDLKFLLESFSCLDTTIHIEGIEFRPIDKVRLEEIRELKQVHNTSKSDSNMDQEQKLSTNRGEILKRSEQVDDDDDEKCFLTSEVNGKKHLLLSAKAALYDYSNVKLFKLKPSAQSRFPDVIELLPQNVFRINFKVKREMLSQDTEYVCYLVYNLFEKCHGPIQVRDLLHWSDEEANIIYFTSPKPWNLHDTNQAPKQRADGWMEVKVWTFNLSNGFEDDDFHINLRLFSYEGTMAGLIVCGLEFRPI